MGAFLRFDIDTIPFAEPRDHRFLSECIRETLFVLHPSGNRLAWPLPKDDKRHMQPLALLSVFVQPAYRHVLEAAVSEVMQLPSRAEHKVSLTGYIVELDVTCGGHVSLAGHQAKWV